MLTKFPFEYGILLIDKVTLRFYSIRDKKDIISTIPPKPTKLKVGLRVQFSLDCNVYVLLGLFSHSYSL